MSKKKVVAYIDGLNLYHALQKKIQSPKKSWKKEYLWCDYKKMLASFLESNESLHTVYFFTAYSARSEDAKLEHEALLKALRKQGVDVILGKFTKVTRTYRSTKNPLLSISYDTEDQPQGATNCRVQTMKYTTFEEKETDVNIALKILEDGLLNNYDIAYIVTGDSDLVPPIKRIHALSKKGKLEKKIFKNIVVPGTKGKTMQRACDSRHLLTSKHFENAMMPDNVKINRKESVQRPESWR